MKNNPMLVFVHGAFSSKRAFNFYKIIFDEYQQLFFEYDWNVSTRAVGKQLADFIEQNSNGREVIIIAHSLGGNVAIHAANRKPTNLIGVITIGSPLGGSLTASWLAPISREQVLKHILPTSPEIYTLQNHAPSVPVYGIVTTIAKGPSLLIPPGGAHDGVVSVASQTSLSYVHYFEIANGHVDVLLSTEACDLIRILIKLIVEQQ
jgi:pimeloyl-ACP methyl ester carboxylesterase